MDETIATLPKRRKRNHADVPAEVLIEVLCHFSRRMLTRKMSWVNSQFYRLSGQYVPAIHMIPELNFTLDNYMLRSTELDVCNFKKMPIPAPYIRINTVKISSCILWLSESFINSMKSVNHIFVGSDLYFSTMRVAVLELLLNEVFTKPYFISFDGTYGDCFLPKILFQTKGVQNCDKMERVATNREMNYSSGKPICSDAESKFYGSDAFDVPECFAAWLHWKHKGENSRRHLILKRYSKDAVFELVNILKKEFQEATAPVNYMVTLPGCGYALDDHDMQNDVTGERLSLFSFQYECLSIYDWPGMKDNFLWRRIPIEKSPGKTSDSEYMLMFKKECAPNKDFDEKFYSVRNMNQ